MLFEIDAKTTIRSREVSPLVHQSLAVHTFTGAGLTQ